MSEFTLTGNPLAMSAYKPSDHVTEPRMRIYISGPMTGLPDLNFPAFHAAAFRLRAAGFAVVNPAELNPGSTDWHECMRADIRALCDCQGIALLDGWMDRSGAHLEVHIAHRLGMAVRNIDHWLEKGVSHG